MYTHIQLKYTMYNVYSIYTVYMYASVNISFNILMYTHTHTLSLYIYIYTHTHTSIHPSIHTCIHTCIHAYVPTCMYACSHVKNCGLTMSDRPAWQWPPRNPAPRTAHGRPGGDGRAPCWRIARLVVLEGAACAETGLSLSGQAGVSLGSY